MNSERGRGLEISPARPESRDGQVLDIAEIVPGARFRQVHTGQESRFTIGITVLELPQEKEGSYWVRVRIRYVFGFSCEGNISLADDGVVPYVDKKGQELGWNTSNYLVRDTSSLQDETPRKGMFPRRSRG